MTGGILRALAAGPLAADGAMGTELGARGLTPPYERYNLERPEAVLDVHRAYRDAGARLLRTNTFQAASRDAVLAGVRLAREVAGDSLWVAGAMGPGTADAGVLAEGGCDLLILETFTDADELLAALRRAKATGLPVAAQMAGLPDARAREEADLVGINCLDPEETLRLAARLKGPLSAFPHAGLPGAPIAPAVFAAAGALLAARGVRLLGGCCGAGPAHVKALVEALR